MKRFLVFTIFLTMAFSHSLFAQEERNWSSLAFSSVGKKLKKPENRIHLQKGLPKWGEFSLREEDSEKLNKVERDLLEKYEDVRITKYSHGYYLINDNAIGLANKSGEVLIEPVEGNVRIVNGAGYLDQFYIFGEQTGDFDRFAASIQTQIDNGTYNVAVPQGLFKAVANMHMKVGNGTWTQIIPAGRYDQISLVVRSSKGALTKKFTGFYVYKRDENGEILCGYCDAEGNEVIPCKYKSVYFDGYKFVGDDTKTMLEQNDYYAKKMQLKKEEVAQRQAAWAAALNSFGNGLNAVAQKMDGPTLNTQYSSSTTATAVGKGSSSAGNYQVEYARWERRAESNYSSITNLGSRVTTKDNGKAAAESGTSGGVGHISTSNYTQMKKALREAQKEMVRIRQKAAKAGVIIPQSRWETATVSY